MVNFLRLVYFTLRAVGRPRRGLLDPSVIRLTVLFNDLDLNLHMNNGRYLSLMDLGRVDLMFRGGVDLWMKHGRQPLVAASFCRYFKPLNLFQAYELHSRLLGWDEKWFYFEQRFLRRGTLHALAAVKALVVDPGGTVPTRVLLAREGAEAPASPPLPDWIKAWLASERGAIELLKSERAAAEGRP
jgi:acyl-CoA thioesterase FadM